MRSDINWNDGIRWSVRETRDMKSMQRIVSERMIGRLGGRRWGNLPEPSRRCCDSGITFVMSGQPCSKGCPECGTSGMTEAFANSLSPE